jgi:hypothetical protein
MRKVVFATAFAAVGALLTQFWSLGSMPAELEGQAPVPVQRSTPLDKAPARAGAGRDSLPPSATEGSTLSKLAADARRDCLHGRERDARFVLQACLDAAALAGSEAARNLLLRRAATAAREHEPALADALLLQAAAAHDAQALAALADVEEPDAFMALVRNEAQWMAASAGVAEARAAQAARHAFLHGQALSEPRRIALLLDGRGLELADDTEARRYHLGLMRGLETACPWQSVLWQNAGFRRAQEQYAAPVQTAAHVRALDEAGHAVSGLWDATTSFGRLLAEGRGYEAAAAEFVRLARGAQRGLNVAASAAGERGARDGARLAGLIGGCDSAEGLRITQALLAVFAAHADRPPKPTAPADGGAPRVDTVASVRP